MATNKRLDTYWFNECIRNNPYYFKPFTIECLKVDTYVSLAGSLPSFVGANGKTLATGNPFEGGGLRFRFSYQGQDSDWVDFGETVTFGEKYYCFTKKEININNQIVFAPTGCEVDAQSQIVKGLPGGMKISILFEPIEVSVQFSKYTDLDGKEYDLGNEPKTCSLKINPISWYLDHYRYLVDKDEDKDKVTFNHSIIVWDGSTNLKPFNLEGNIMSLIYGNSFVGQKSLIDIQEISYPNYIAEVQYDKLNQDDPKDAPYKYPLLKIVRNKFNPNTYTTADFDTLDEFTFTSVDELGVTRQIFVKRNDMYIKKSNVFTQLTNKNKYNFQYDVNAFRGFASNQLVIDAQNLILPAEDLGLRCYQDMFKNCKRLLSMPKMSAANIIDLCYAGMFEGCENLASECLYLPAPTSISYHEGNNETEEYSEYFPYRRMFAGCKKLTKIECHITEHPDIASFLRGLEYYDNGSEQSYAIFDGCLENNTFADNLDLIVVTPGEEWECRGYWTSDKYDIIGPIKVGDVVDSAKVKIKMSKADEPSIPDVTDPWTIEHWLDYQGTLVDFLYNQIPMLTSEINKEDNKSFEHLCNLDMFLKKGVLTNNKWTDYEVHILDENDIESYEHTCYYPNIFFGNIYSDDLDPKPYTNEDTYVANWKVVNFKKTKYVHPNQLYVERPLTFNVIKTCEFEWGELHPSLSNESQNCEGLQDYENSWLKCVYHDRESIKNDDEYNLLVRKIYNTNTSLVASYLTSLEYTLDGGTTWKTYTHKIIVPAGKTISWRIKNNIREYYDPNTGEIYKFSNSQNQDIPSLIFKPRFRLFENVGGQFEACGNIMSIVDPEYDTYIYPWTASEEKQPTDIEIPYPFCFTGIFARNKALYSARNLCLPATKLKLFCYDSMFAECTNMSHPPYILPAYYGSRELDEDLVTGEWVSIGGDYANMFKNCSNLLSCPIMRLCSLQTNEGLLLNNDDYTEKSTLYIKDTTTPEEGSNEINYNQMGYYWESNVADKAGVKYKIHGNICQYMFQNCESLIKAPFLNLYKDMTPNIAGALNGLKGMFKGCKNLQYAKIWTMGQQYISDATNLEIFYLDRDIKNGNFHNFNNSVLLVGPISDSDFSYSLNDAQPKYIAKGYCSKKIHNSYGTFKAKVYHDSSSEEVGLITKDPNPIEGSSELGFVDCFALGDGVSVARKLDRNGVDRMGQNLNYQSYDDQPDKNPPPYYPDVKFNFAREHENNMYKIWIPGEKTESSGTVITVPGVTELGLKDFISQAGIRGFLAESTIYDCHLAPNEYVLKNLSCNNQNFQYRLCFNINPMLVGWDHMSLSLQNKLDKNYEEFRNWLKKNYSNNSIFQKFSHCMYKEQREIYIPPLTSGRNVFNMGAIGLLDVKTTQQRLNTAWKGYVLSKYKGNANEVDVSKDQGFVTIDKVQYHFNIRDFSAYQKIVYKYGSGGNYQDDFSPAAVKVEVPYNNTYFEEPFTITSVDVPRQINFPNYVYRIEWDSNRLSQYPFVKKQEPNKFYNFEDIINNNFLDFYWSDPNISDNSERLSISDPKIEDAYLISFKIDFNEVDKSDERYRPDLVKTYRAKLGSSWATWMVTDHAKEFRKDTYCTLPREVTEDYGRSAMFNGLYDNNAEIPFYSNNLNSITKSIHLNGEIHSPIYINNDEEIKSYYFTRKENAPYQCTQIKVPYNTYRFYESSGVEHDGGGVEVTTGYELSDTTPEYYGYADPVGEGYEGEDPVSIDEDELENVCIDRKYEKYICVYDGIPCHFQQRIQNGQTYKISTSPMKKWHCYDLGDL